MKVFVIIFFTICILCNFQLSGKAQSVDCDKGQNTLYNNPYSSVAEEFIRAIKKKEIKIAYYVRNYKDNPDYIEVLVNGEQIPKGVPSTVISIRVQFYKIGNNSEKRVESYPLKLCPGRWSNMFPRKPKGFESNNSGFNVLLRPVLKVGETSFAFSDDDARKFDLSSLAAEAEKRNFENYMLLEEDEYIALKLKKRNSINEIFEEKSGEEEKESDTKKQTLPKVVLSSDCQITKYLSVKELIESSDAIVLATAIDYSSSKGKAVDGVKIKPINFKVERILKGNKLNQITLDGLLSQQDYKGSAIIDGTKIGREGKTVNCVIADYKRNEKYLIFLKNIEGKIKLYWYPAAPVNEQIFEKDPWLKFVEDELSN